MAKKLHRSRKDRVLFGVLGGVAEYFDIDSTLARVLFVLIVLGTGGFGIIAYVVMAIIFPVEGIPEDTPPDETLRQNVKEMADTAESIAGGLRAGLKRDNKPHHQQGIIAGLVLIVLGVVFLLVNLDIWAWLVWGNVWPVLVIVVGLILLVGLNRRRR